MKYITYHLVISAHCIEDGVAGVSCSCPIAIAMNEQIPDACEVAVGTHRAEFYHEGLYKHMVCILPYTATVFIGLYDYLLPVDPISFDAVFEYRED